MSSLRYFKPILVFLAALMGMGSSQAQWLPWDGWAPRGQPLPWDGWWYQYGAQPYYYVPPATGVAPAPAGQAQACPPATQPTEPAPVRCEDSDVAKELTSQIESLKAAHGKALEALKSENTDLKARLSRQQALAAKADGKLEKLLAEHAQLVAELAQMKQALAKKSQASKAKDRVDAAAKVEVGRLKKELAALRKSSKRLDGQLRAAIAARKQCVDDAETAREEGAARISSMQASLKQCEQTELDAVRLKRQIQDQLKDDDGDGVANGLDRCAGTRSGIEVMSNGCEADDDHDGIANSQDLCAGTKPDTDVDDSGCVADQAIALQGVQFVSGSADLLPAAKAILNKLAVQLRSRPAFRAEVAGHTDSAGDAGFNLKLSQARAEAVKAWLVKQGVAEQQLTAKGYGETQPVADNRTSAGRATNRRVELRRIPPREN